MTKEFIDKLAEIIEPNVFSLGGDHSEGRCEICDAARSRARNKVSKIVDEMRANYKEWWPVDAD